VEDIRRRGKLPIVVGGTGLYIDGLLRGVDYAAAPEDPATRAALEEEYDRLGGEAFREKLRAVDPARAELLHPGDKKRLVRAMEVYILTGETITAHDERSRSVPPRYRALTVALDFRDRAVLYERIDRRVDFMMEEGLYDEVLYLKAMGLSREDVSMQGLGYKEMLDCMDGLISLEEAVRILKRDTRHFAKRQITWFKREKDALWIDRADFGNDSIRIAEFMKDQVCK
jgi:tRNA dimethylallyltransferase